MSFDERARWTGLFALDAVRGGRLREYYESVKDAYLFGTPEELIESKLKNGSVL